MQKINQILILVVLLFSTVTAYSQCETYLQKADVFFAQKNYAEAKKQYQAYKICDQTPNTYVDRQIAACGESIQASEEQCNKYLLEGDSYFRSGYYSKALEQYSLLKQCATDKTVAEQKIAECNKMICEKHLREAQSYQRQGYYANAKEEYKLYQRCNPDAVGINVQIAECDRLECEKLLNDGRTLYRQGNYQGAIQKYNQYKACYPDGKTTADNEIANCNQAIQREKEAKNKEIQRQIEQTSRELQNLFKR